MHTISRLVLRVVPSVAVVRVMLVPVDVPVDMIMGVIWNHVVTRSALPSRRWYLSRLLELRFVRQVHTGRRLEAQRREQPVENKCSVTVRQHAIWPSRRLAPYSHQHREPDHLQERKRPQQPLPPNDQTDDPNPERPARVDGAPRRCADSACHAEAKVVESADAKADCD
jgi:hypothetical protein